MQIVCGVFEQGKVLRRLDGKNEWLRRFHHSCHRIDVEVCEFAEEHLVFAVFTFRDPEAIIPELHPSFGPFSSLGLVLKVSLIPRQG